MDSPPRFVKDYLLTSKVFAVEEDHYHVSVTAAPAELPRQGVISRHYDCTSLDDVEGFLEVLVQQVCDAVTSIGGRVITTGRPPLV